jgi:5-methylthioribose kinase
METTEKKKRFLLGIADMEVITVGSKDLTIMTNDQLCDRLEELLNADPKEEDSNNDFLIIQNEIKVIENELEYRRLYGASK